MFNYCFQTCYYCLLLITTMSHCLIINAIFLGQVIEMGFDNIMNIQPAMIVQATYQYQPGTGVKLMIDPYRHAPKMFRMILSFVTKIF